MEDLETICRYFKEEILQHGGDPVQSLVLHGSSLGPEFRPGISDYNFVVLADPINVDFLGRLAGRMPKWHKKRITAPLVLGPAMIKQSLDTYPLEFLSMQSRYQILHGPDFLKELAFEKPFVRLQCERELKSKLLLFRRAFLESGGAPKKLQQLVGHGLPSLGAIFRGMLFLKDGPWTTHGRELFDACEKHLNLPGPLLHGLHDLRRQKGSQSREEILRQYSEMLGLLQGLALEVDGW